MTDLCGAVLAGGQSRRMGGPKSSLRVGGRTFLECAVGLLESVCSDVWVSVGSDIEARRWAEMWDYRVLFDAEPHGGPLAGIHSALIARPEAAWLIVAVDMPLLSEEALEILLRGRDQYAQATAFRRPDVGGPEPLCTIWEPGTSAVVDSCVASGRLSVTASLLQLHVRLIPPPDEMVLRNVNTPQDLEAIRARLREPCLRETEGQRSSS